MVDFFSIEGFNYLIRELEKHPSKQTIQEWLETLYTPIPGEVKILDPNNRKKYSQYEGILRIINNLKPSGDILEIGCGDGELSFILSSRFPCKVLGIDKNRKRIERNNNLPKPPNLSFQFQDAFDSSPQGKFGLVVGLHCCGNLTDKVIDAAVSNKADIIAVPCCYGSIHKNGIILPRSAELARRPANFEYALERARALEGYVAAYEDSVQYFALELTRRLIDMDRIFYLREHGYKTSVSRLSEKEIKIPNGDKIRSSPLRDAIVGKFTR